MNPKGGKPVNPYRLAAQSHCKHGHDLSVWLRVRNQDRGLHYCMRCKELSNQRYRARQRAKLAAEEAALGYTRPSGQSLSSVRKNIFG